MQSESTGGQKGANSSGGTSIQDNILSNISLDPPGSMEGSLEDSECQGFQIDSAQLSSDQPDPQAAAASTELASSGQDRAQDGVSSKAKSDHLFDNMGGVDLPDYVKTHDTHLTFPEKLMLMLMHIEGQFESKRKPLKEAPIMWAMQGKAFVIRDREEFIRSWLPLFFRHAKFSSFTRKLYRWGFRQISSPRGFDSSTDRELYFFNSNFQKSNKNLMANMSSVTAETKRQQQRRESANNADMAVPLALAHYPFAEAKEQSIGDMFMSSQLAFQQSGMAQSALDFQMNMTPTFGLNQSLNNALASQLSSVGPAALFGLQGQNTAFGAAGPSLMAMYPQSFQLTPQSTRAMSITNFQSQSSPEASTSQWTLQQLQLLGFAPHQQTSSNAQQFPSDSSTAFDIPGNPMAGPGGWIGDGRLPESNQLGNSQQLAEMVLRYGAANVPSLQQIPRPPFPPPPAPSPG